MYQVLIHNSLTLTVKTSRNEASSSDPDLVEIYNISDIDKISFVKCSCCEDRFVVVAGEDGSELKPRDSFMSKEFREAVAGIPPQPRLV